MNPTSGTPENIKQKRLSLKRRIWANLKKNRGGEASACIEREDLSSAWEYLLGPALTIKLITEAHENAKIFKELVKEETKKYNQERIAHLNKLKKEKSDDRKQLARGASAAT